MTVIQFGDVEKLEVIDDEGSTVAREDNYRNGQLKPVRSSYRIRKRVHSQKEEHEQYLEFSNQASLDETMLDTHFFIERPKLGKQNGYYYVVLCYTRIER